MRNGKIFKLRKRFWQNWFHISQKTIINNFHAWMDAVNKRDLDFLTNLYTKTHLVSTFSGYMYGAEKAGEYFKNLAGKNCVVSISEPQIVNICTFVVGYTILGKYFFEFDHSSGQRKKVEANFTFTYVRRWLFFGKLILFVHHSSATFNGEH